MVKHLCGAERVRSWRRWAVVLCLSLAIATDAAGAGSSSHKAKPRSKPKTLAAPKASAKTPQRVAPKADTNPVADLSTLCIEARSGLVISEQNADLTRPAASMVKMLLLLLVAEGIRDGSWMLETPISATAHAQGMGGTQVFLKQGETFTLDQLMAAVCVASANDAAMVVAEGLWGSEDAYRKRMNDRAAELGMANSIFFSVHGLPPDKGDDPDRTTARDMARLAQFCVLHPLILGWVSQKELVFRPGEAAKFNTNKLLWRMNGCDGLKTGYTRSAAFCVTATAQRDGIRLIAVVMGANGNHDRFGLAQQLLEDGFANVCRKRVLAKGEPVGNAVPVVNCETPKVRLTAAEDLYVVVRKEDADKLEIAPQLPAFLQPPVSAGTVLGETQVQIAGKLLGTTPLVAATDLAEAGWRWRLIESVLAHPSRAQTK